MTEEEARDFVRARCTRHSFAKLERFGALLTEESRRQNLVAAASLDVLWTRHIADSAQLLDHFGSGVSGPVTDFGSGAGLPGLVLAMMRPDLHFTLIESRKLRIAWLEAAAEKLALSNITVAGGDAARIQPFPAAIITARAFAPLEKLLILCAPFSTPQSLWLLPKGRSAEQEVMQLPESQRTMFHVEQSVTDPTAGIVIGRGKVREP